MGKMNLSKSEQQELESLQRKRTAAVAQVRRAKLILLLDEGASRDAIMDGLSCDSRFIATWKARFTEERLAGLYGRHPGRAPRRNLPRLEDRVLEYTLKRAVAGRLGGGRAVDGAIVCWLYGGQKKVVLNSAGEVRLRRG